MRARRFFAFLAFFVVFLFFQKALGQEREVELAYSIDTNSYPVWPYMDYEQCMMGFKHGGGVVLPPQFETVASGRDLFYQRLSTAFFVVQKQGLYGMIDEFGQQLLPIKYDTIIPIRGVPQAEDQLTVLIGLQDGHVGYYNIGLHTFSDLDFEWPDSRERALLGEVGLLIDQPFEMEGGFVAKRRQQWMVLNAKFQPLFTSPFPIARKLKDDHYLIGRYKGKRVEAAIANTDHDLVTPFSSQQLAVHFKDSVLKLVWCRDSNLIVQSIYDDQGRKVWSGKWAKGEPSYTKKVNWKDSSFVVDNVNLVKGKDGQVRVVNPMGKDLIQLDRKDRVLAILDSVDPRGKRQPTGIYVSRKGKVGVYGLYSLPDIPVEYDRISNRLPGLKKPVVLKAMKKGHTYLYSNHFQFIGGPFASVMVTNELNHAPITSALPYKKSPKNLLVENEEYLYRLDGNMLKRLDSTIFYSQRPYRVLANHIIDRSGKVVMRGSKQAWYGQFKGGFFLKNNTTYTVFDEQLNERYTKNLKANVYNWSNPVGVNMGGGGGRGGTFNFLTGEWTLPWGYSHQVSIPSGGYWLRLDEGVTADYTHWKIREVPNHGDIEQEFDFPIRGQHWGGIFRSKGRFGLFSLDEYQLKVPAEYQWLLPLGHSNYVGRKEAKMTFIDQNFHPLDREWDSMSYPYGWHFMVFDGLGTDEEMVAILDHQMAYKVPPTPTVELLGNNQLLPLLPALYLSKNNKVPLPNGLLVLRDRYDAGETAVVRGVNMLLMEKLREEAQAMQKFQLNCLPPPPHKLYGQSRFPCTQELLTNFPINDRSVHYTDADLRSYQDVRGHYSSWWNYLVPNDAILPWNNHYTYINLQQGPGGWQPIHWASLWRNEQGLRDLLLVHFKQSVQEGQYFDLSCTKVDPFVEKMLPNYSFNGKGISFCYHNQTSFVGMPQTLVEFLSWEEVAPYVDPKGAFGRFVQAGN